MDHVDPTKPGSGQSLFVNLPCLTMSSSPLLHRKTGRVSLNHRRILSINILLGSFLVLDTVLRHISRHLVHQRFQIASSSTDSLATGAFSLRSTNYANCPYRVYKSRSIRCDQGDPEDTRKSQQNDAYINGIMYVNSIQSDDDIVGSVALQIAQPTKCKVLVETLRRSAEFVNTSASQSAMNYFFSFTFIRSPTEHEPSDPIFQKYLQEHGYVDRSLQELSTQVNSRAVDGDVVEVTHVIESILHDFDFIGVSERLDESLVVMKLLLGLKTSQVLYLANPSPFVFHNGKCVLIAQPFVSPEMRLFFDDTSWQSQIRGDMMLYLIANRSLDKTIEHLGRELVEKELLQYQAAVRHARNVCLEDVVFLCNYDGMSQGKTNTCLHNRYGCASSCLSGKTIVEKVDRL